ncbi:hypothetical protein [Halostella litorea]|uniref:hypothetical protein n=1 Tax=Halostella litorea TaxID=2528831 RepID=UPI001091A61B|nr:hypothetical protein [Halostella litorea]
MDLPNPTTSGGVFRYLMAFLLLVLAVLVLYAAGVVAGLVPPPTWFPEPGTDAAASTLGASTPVLAAPGGLTRPSRSTGRSGPHSRG